MSLPANDHSDLSAPTLPTPNVGPTPMAPPTLAAPAATTLTAPHPSIDTPTSPAAPVDLTLDGDLPRLGTASPAPAPTTAPTTPPADTLAGTSTVTPTPGIELPSLPSLPTAAAVMTAPTGIPAPDDRPDEHVASPSETPEPVGNAGPAHPMAHLMPEKAAPTEASRKAAELRAAKKAKAKKIQLAVAAGMLVFTVVVGPPLWNWLTNAINESGSTSTEEPAD